MRELLAMTDNISKIRHILSGVQMQLPSPEQSEKLYSYLKMNKLIMIQDNIVS
jgi:hypothetical protein